MKNLLKSRLKLCALPLLLLPTINYGQLFTTDVIVQGSICVGIDCVSGENFGSDTERLKENNLRIHFDDTSASASFPSNDWRITINDQTNGGENYFGIDDATAGTRPMKIEAGAGNNAVVVSSSGGNVGLGTASPVVELHVTDGDSPTLRLEQNGSNGWTPQTWDIAGNETNFFIRDVTNGSKLPFKIKPGAPDNAIFIQASGKVSLGTSIEKEQLHVQGGISAVNSVFVGDNISVEDSMFVGSNTRLDSNLFVGNNVHIDSSLFVDDNVHVDDSLFVNGNTSLASDLSVGGNTSLGNNLSVGGNISVVNSVMVDDNISVDDSLFVGGNTSLASDLSVGGNTSLANDLFIGGNISIDDSLFVGRNIRVDNKLSVGGNTSLDSNLFVAGNIRAEGNISLMGEILGISDRRIKTDIHELRYGISDVMKLSPKEYQFTNDNFNELKLSKELQLGLIAQEANEIIPELISDNVNAKDKNGTMQTLQGINYVGLIPVLIKAMQEQQAQIEARDEELESVKNQLAELNAKFDLLAEKMTTSSTHQQKASSTDYMSRRDSKSAKVLPAKEVEKEVIYNNGRSDDQ